MMPRAADLVKRVDRGILAVMLEYNVEVDHSVGGRGTKILPVFRDGVPRVLHTCVTPKWCRKHREIGEGHCGKDGEQRETVVMHDYRE